MIMGILNVTPDSFSDGGQHNTPAQAIKRAIEMANQGANIIDIGGESTRPGAKEVSTQEQLDRVIPVIEGIRKSESKSEPEPEPEPESKKIIISIDTTDYQVAKQALEAGANWINDISAGEGSLSADGTEQMITLAATKNCPIILMHRQGKSDRMQNKPTYDDVCKEVKEYLLERAQLALEAGVTKDNIILDPGIGFGKNLEHNLALLADLESLVKLDFPVLLGASRKRFLGEILGEDDPMQRIAATCATTALGVQAGVNVFRVHDVIENKQAMDVAWAIRNKP
ncbi:MAG: dihydropteroate synthase [Cocleimonas sp.]